MADDSRLSIIALVDPDVISEPSPDSSPELLARVIAIEEKRQAAKSNAARGKRIERLKAEQARRAGQPKSPDTPDDLIEQYAKIVGELAIERFEKDGKQVAALFMKFAPAGKHGGSVIYMSVTFANRTGVQVELGMKDEGAMLHPEELVGRLRALEQEKIL